MGEVRQMRPPATAEPGTAPERALTDVGNGERLLDRHGRDLRYCHAMSAWLAWDGRRWAVDATAEVERRAKETVAVGIAVEALNADDPDRSSALMKHGAKSQSAQRVMAALAMASSDERAVVLPEQLDADPWLLTVDNGTLDLRTGQLRPHDRRDYITRLAPVRFDPGAKGPRWQAFIERVLPDPEVRGFVQRLAGYALTGCSDEHVLSLLLGNGANGKSVLTRTLLDMLGDYALTAAADLLIATRRTGGASPEVAELAGRRLVVVSETDEGAPLAEGRVKTLVGGDRTKGRQLYQGYREIEPTWTLVLVTNHAPQVTGQDGAIWRRLALVPFDVVIPDEDRDRRLVEKLATERSAILAWALEGCMEWQRDGLRLPEAVRAATEGYRADSDQMADWLVERVVRVAHGEETPADLYADYVKFTRGGAVVGQRMFAERLRTEGFTQTRTKKRRLWRGLKLAGGGQW